MRITTIRGFLLAVIAAAAMTLLPASASAASSNWQTCIGAIALLDCGTYTMPLDRTGKVPGTTTVRAIRLPAQVGPRMGTIFVIAGGPGQTSFVMLGLMATLFSEANRYDIIAVDQRGSGSSEPLLCPRIELGSFTWDGSDPKTDQPITNCSVALGAPRAAYNTAEAVADLETVRADLGVDTATFFGVSYGTKVALAYAKAHPSRAKALLLDSVLPTDLPPAFDTDSLAALRGALAQICNDGRCRGIGGTPLANIEKLAARLLKRPIPAFSVSPSGKLSVEKIDADALYAISAAADINPWIYNQLPGTVRSALEGNDAQLQRLYAVLTGSVGTSDSLSSAKRASRLAQQQKPRSVNVDELKRGDSVRGREMIDVSEFSSTMFFATTCADFDAPWPRSDDVTGRQPLIDAAVGAIPAAQLKPFPRKTVSANSTAAICRGWQQDPVLPAINQGPLPNIPTLALSGSLDTRTPASWATKGVAGNSLAQEITVPNVGHSSIGMDLSECSLSLAKRFLIFGGTDGKCKRTAPAIPIAPKPDTSIASVAAAPGGCRRISKARCKRTLKVLTAGYQALRDTMDQIQIGGSDFGPGLYGGFWEIDYDMNDEFAFDPTQVFMQGVSSVPGVSASGSFSIDGLPRIFANLRIGGYRVRISGRVAYDRASDSLTLNARRGRTTAHIRIKPSARADSATSLTRSKLAFRRNYALATGATLSPLPR